MVGPLGTKVPFSWAAVDFPAAFDQFDDPFFGSRNTYSR
jgi:hypothetical protein